ncbi:hypothetical protein Pmani_003142, partial [Petrolisthes manimaculis]
SQYLHLQRTSVSLLTHQDCVFFVALRYTLTQVELQTILAIAVTRALAVATPRMYSVVNTTRVIGCYIAVIWLYSIALKIPPALGYLGKYGFNAKTMECDLRPDPSPLARLILIIIEAIIPVILIFVLYIFVFIMVKLSSARVARASVRCTNSSATTRVPPPASTSTTSENEARKGSTSSFKSLKKMVSESSLRNRFRRQSSTISQRMGTSRRDLRVARTIFIIFIMVLVCSVPVMCVHVLDYEVTQPNRFLLLHVLYWVQYCLNVVVYVLMNRQYRDAYVDCLARVFPRIKRHHGRRFFWERPSVSSRPAPNLTSTKPQAGGIGSYHNQYDSSDARGGDEDQPSRSTAPGGGGGVTTSTTAGERSPMPQGRLNTIPEGSSAASDSVFGSDPPKKNNEQQQQEQEQQEKLRQQEKQQLPDEIQQEQKQQDRKQQLTRKDGIDECDGDDDNDDDGERSGSEEADEHDALMNREHWVTQNGAMGTGSSLPHSESMV